MAQSRMITLRQDQIDLVNAARSELRNHQSVLFQAAPGFGKTVAAAYIAKSVQDKGNRAIFAVHRKELLYQTAKTFFDFGIKYSYIAAGMRFDPKSSVFIASADTLKSRLHLLEGCNIFVPDEAHLWMNGKTRLAILQAAKDAGSKIMPLTATPQAGNGKGWGCIADAVAEGPSVEWLIANGHLARYKAYAPRKADLSGLHTRNGDYIPAELDERFDKPAIVGDRVAMYRQYAFGKRHIGYCYNRANGNKTAAAFRDAGIPAAFIDGDTPHDERRAIIGAFADGETPVLINCQLFREGFDLSSQVGRNVPIQSVGLYAPTKSTPLAIQMMMRAMRKQDGYATLIDHANIFEDHGLPDDEREWPRDGRVKAKADDGKVRTSTCKACSYTYRTGPRECPECGHSEQSNGHGGREVEEVDGVLEEVNVEALRARRKAQVKSARDLESLAALAAERGYKPGWIINTMKHRGKNPPSFQQAATAILEAKNNAK
jgi:superfamily II DNA or RNA helicase